MRWGIDGWIVCEIWIVSVGSCFFELSGRWFDLLNEQPHQTSFHVCRLMLAGMWYLRFEVFQLDMVLIKSYAGQDFWNR